MCEMCAYIGREREAVPILLKYGKRVESLWSGFCTGIGVQMEDGSFVCRKTLGYSKYWEKLYSPHDLPGKIGFFHSRTGYQNCPGDSRYAHPFLASDGAAMGVSQGALGIFAPESSSIIKIGNMLVREGRKLSSADYELDADRFYLLEDGGRVHMSDVVMEYASYLVGKGLTPMETIRKVGTDILEESASMLLFRDFPGHLFVINVNQRLGIYCHEDGLSLATCALAFGEKKVPLIEIPSNTIADLTADTITFEPLSKDLHPLMEVPGNMREETLAWIKNNPGTMLANIMDNVLKIKYPEGSLRHVPTHEVFEDLYYDGLLELVTEEHPGIREVENSIRTVLKLKLK